MLQQWHGCLPGEFGSKQRENERRDVLSGMDILSQRERKRITGIMMNIGHEQNEGIGQGGGGMASLAV